MPEDPAHIHDLLASRHLPLRLRLTLWMITVFSVVAVAMLGIFWLYERHEIRSRWESLIADFTTEMARDLSPLLPGLTDEQLRTLRDRRVALFPHQPLCVKVFDDSGALVAQQPRSPLTWEQLGLASFPSVSQPALGEQPLSILPVAPDEAEVAKTATLGIRAADGRQFVLVVITSDAAFQRRFFFLNEVAAASGLLGIVAAAISSWFIAGIAVAPYARLREMAQRLEPGGATQGDRRQHVSSAADAAGLSEELEHARQRIRERFAAQERFLSHVSHEIKTPIAVVLVEAQTLNTRDASQDVRNFVASTRDELTRLGRLLESLLALTRIRNGQRAPRLLTCGINDVAMDSLQACATMASQYRVALSPHLLGDEDGVDASVSGDPELLRSMLDNLLRSAIRYSPEHERVELRLSATPLTITISVLDHGSVVPPDALPTLFDRFAPNPHQARSGRGQGLGLAIAQGIAELHGGHIAASNRQDRGCNFTITLPRVATTLDTNTTPQAASANHQPATP